MEKNKSREQEEVCRVEADEVKYMMLLNALNESEREADQNFPADKEPDNHQGTE